MASSNPRVLIAASIYPPDPGGPAIHAKRQFEWFKKEGIKTDLVALAHYRKYPIGVRHFFYLCALLLKVNSFDLIYTHDAVGAGIPALVAARLFNKKIIARIGGDLAWESQAENSVESMLEWYESGKFADSKYYKLSKWLLKRVDLIIVPSPLLTSIYTKYYSVDASRIVLIPNPIPEVNLQPTKNEPIIFYASRLVGYKNLELVLRVLKKVFSKHLELTFVIAGDGPDREHLKEIAKSLEIDKKVLFKGTVSQAEVLDYTSRCLFTLAPALTEFNPNYVLQGLSMNKPFIMSKENGLAFPVPSEITFSSHSEIELEERIEFLLVPENYIHTQEKLKNCVVLTTWEMNLTANIKAIKSLV